MLTRYWVWLSSLQGLSPLKKKQVLDVYGSPERVYNATKDELSSIYELTAKEKEILCNKNLDAADKILEDCEKQNIKIMLYNDNNYPELLKKIEDPPLVIYYRGRLTDMKNEFPIATIGTRTPSVYGMKMAQRFSYELACAGMTIVSGMARGIDTICHEGALRANSNTIAVLGCGVDITYPPENASIKKIIEENGAVISEYPPGTGPLPFNFPQRNRIISGLSLGIFIVECGERSGTLITARLAGEYGRNIYTIPTNIDNKRGAGNLFIIQDGAKMVMDPIDIFKDYLCSYPERIVGAMDKKEELDLTDDESRIIKVLNNSIPMGIDEICDLTAMKAQDVSAKMIMLELEGKVACISGKRYIIK